MKNFWKDLKIKREVNARTAQIRKLVKEIEFLQRDSACNDRMITCLKSRMYLVDGNQPDLFDN